MILRLDSSSRRPPRDPAEAAGAVTRVAGPRGRSTSWHIAIVAGALLLPCLALSGLLTQRLLQSERTRLESEAYRLSADTAAKLDRFVASRIATLKALATSPALDDGNVGRFEEQARAVAAIEGADVVLCDREGRQIINTAFPSGATRPTEQCRAAGEAIAPDKPEVSNLIASPVTGASLVVIRVPVLRDGRLLHMLGFALPPAAMAAALDFAGLAKPYRASLVDGAGRIVTRSIEPERYVGQVLPGFAAITGRQGVWNGINPEGMPVFGTYRRSELTSWTVTTGLESAALEAPLRDSLAMIAMLAGVLLASGLTIAIPVARRLVTAQAALAGIARALRDGELMVERSTGVREADEVAAGMMEASDRLRRQAEALTQANSVLEQRVAERTAELSEAGDFLRATLDSMDQGLAVIDPDGRMPIISRRAVALLGLPPEILGTVVTIDEIRAIQETMGEFANLDARTSAAIARNPVTELPPVYERTRTNGTVVEVRTVALPNGGAVRTYTDVSERRRVEAIVAASEKRYRALADALPQKVWITRPDGTTLYVNAQASAYHGPVGGDLAGRLALCHPDDAGRLAIARDEACRDGVAMEIEGRLRRRDGAWRWHKLAMVPIRDDATGEIVEWLGTSLDIDDIYAAKQKLEEKTELLRLAQDAAGAGVWEWDAGTNRVRLSRESARMWGWPCEPTRSLEMSAEDWGLRCHPDDRDMVWDLVGRALRKRGGYSAEFRISPIDAPAGVWRWISGCGRVVLDPHGEPRGLVGLNFDITERKEAERRIEHLARHDELTGVLNRTAFRDHLRRSFARLKRHGGGLALLCLDLDHFKAVNDTHGHLAGDEILRQVATRLTAVLRNEDMLARLGGDEFAVVLTGQGRSDEAVQAAERLIAAIRRPFNVMGHEIGIGLSVGVAHAGAGGMDPDALHLNADAALYAAKAAGRNMVSVFGSPDLRRTGVA